MTEFSGSANLKLTDAKHTPSPSRTQSRLKTAEQIPLFRPSFPCLILPIHPRFRDIAGRRKQREHGAAAPRAELQEDAPPPSNTGGNQQKLKKLSKSRTVLG
jgi:hypothetical protein